MLPFLPLSGGRCRWQRLLLASGGPCVERTPQPLRGMCRCAGPEAGGLRRPLQDPSTCAAACSIRSG